MNSIHNEIARISANEHILQKLEQAKKQQLNIENDGFHRYVNIGNSGSKLQLLCRTDGKGQLLPTELVRIRKIKKELGIKD